MHFLPFFVSTFRIGSPGFQVMCTEAIVQLSCSYKSFLSQSTKSLLNVLYEEVEAAIFAGLDYNCP